MPLDSSHVLVSERETLDRDGVVCLRKLLQPEDIEILLDEIADYIERVVPRLDHRMMSYEPSPEGKGVIRGLFWMNAHCEFFRELAHDSRLSSLVSSIVDWEPVPHYVEYFAKSPRIGAALHVHQDAPTAFIEPPHSVVLWIALDPANVNNGGVHFYQGSHKLGVLSHNYAHDWYLTLEDTRVLDNRQPVCFELEPGDATAHLSTTVHFSDDNRSAAPRRGLAVAYRSARSIVDERRYQQLMGIAWPT